MWFTILKADSIGNWSNIYLGKEPYPSDENINSLEEAEQTTQAKRLDTTINSIENALQDIPEKKPDIENTNIGTMRVFGAGREGRKNYVEPLGVEGATKELEKLKTFRGKFSTKTTSQSEVKEQLQPLIDKAEQSKSFDDIMEIWKYINGITDSKWMSSTQMWMRKLSDVVETTDEFAKVINANLANKHNYGYVEQVAKILGWGLKGKRETIEVAGGKSNKLVVNNEVKKPKAKYMSTFTNNKSGVEIRIQHEGKSKKAIAAAKKRAEKQASEGVTYKDTTPSKSKTQLQETTKKRRRTKPGTLAATRTDELYQEAVPNQNIELKIQQMKSLIKFRRFINILHTSGATNNTDIEPFKEQGVDILHDVAIVSQRKLDDTVRLIDYGRKGLSLSHRQSPYKLEFAEYYLDKEISQVNGPFKMGSWNIDPDLDQLTKDEVKEQKKQRIGAIGWIQEQIREKSGNVYEEFKEYVKQSSKARVDARNLLNQAREAAGDDKVSQDILDKVKTIYKDRGISLGEGSLDFYLGRGDGSINLNNSIASFDIPEDKVFLSTMWAWLFKLYSESNDSVEFENKVKVLSTKEDWTNYIPAGRNFASIGNESFELTMKTILTLVIIFFGKEFLENYNNAISRISKKFYLNMEKSKDFIEEEEGEDDSAQQLEMIIEGYLEDELPEVHQSLLGCREHLDAIVKDLNELLLDLDDKVHTIIHEICREIGKDTEGTYTTNKVDLNGQPASAKEHLVNMGLLIELKEDEEE